MMNKYLIIIILGLLSYSAKSQNWRIWATYYGGGDMDKGTNIATDNIGNIYVCGSTLTNSGIATAGAFQTSSGGGSDAFLVKFTSSGSRLWATYFGGTGDDAAVSVKTDVYGNVYLYGNTLSTSSISTPGAFQTNNNGNTDAFLVKFSSSGTRLWATYFGGSDQEYATNVATDPSGNVYITGNTLSTTGIASPSAFQTTIGGLNDGFLAKFNPSGVRLWSTYFGGSQNDYGFDVATDANSNVFMSGFTFSDTGIAYGSPFQNTYNDGGDAFLAKFNSGGNIIWSTYYGGDQVDFGYGLATGPGGCVYMTGMTSSLTGIAYNGFQNTFGGARDGFLVKFDASCNRLWATYYGGAQTEEAEDLAVDAAGNVFLSGDTYSPNTGNCIATVGGFQTNISGTENLFLAAFTSNGTRLSSTYYGQNHEEDGHVALGQFGEVYLEGATTSLSGISWNGFQNSFGGGSHDAVLVKFSASVPDTGIIVPNDNFPPIISTAPTIILGTISLFDGGSISISSAMFKNFSGNIPLPATGPAYVSFSSDFNGSSFNSGIAATLNCTGNLRVRIDPESSLGQTQTFQTEMLQLDLSGGNFPSGLRLRESPSRPSIGRISITSNVDGTYRMSGYFDVFTEVSTDGGQSWQSSSGPPSRLTLQREDLSHAVPLLSTPWLVLYIMLIVIAGIISLVYNKRKIENRI